MRSPAERAVVFVDGNNWYHGLKAAGIAKSGWLDYAAVSRKLVGPRRWIGTRYYIGRVPQYGNRWLSADQQRYIGWLRSLDPRIAVFFGRLERRSVQNIFAREVLAYLGNLPVRIDPCVYRHLVDTAKQHERTLVMVEKAVDVMLAVDMVRMADRDEFDTAYLLAADGDYTPAVEAAMGAGKTVFAAAVEPAPKLAAVVHRFIRLKREWFEDCFR